MQCVLARFTAVLGRRVVAQADHLVYTMQQRPANLDVLLD